MTAKLASHRFQVVRQNSEKRRTDAKRPMASQYETDCLAPSRTVGTQVSSTSPVPSPNQSVEVQAADGHDRFGSMGRTVAGRCNDGRLGRHGRLCRERRSGWRPETSLPTMLPTIWLESPENILFVGHFGRRGSRPLSEPDPALAMITATFTDLDVVKSRGGYTQVDPRSGTPIARLKPIPQSDRFKLSCWSDMRGRWRKFGDFGRLRPTIERAREIFREETFVHTQGGRWICPGNAIEFWPRSAGQFWPTPRP